jgi:hypothetical protein
MELPENIYEMRFEFQRELPESEVVQQALIS